MTRDAKGRFVKGARRPLSSGRGRGTPNKATVALKEFMSALVDDPEVQEAVRQRVLNGDTTASFKAAEMVYGKPKQTLDVSPGEMKMFATGQPTTLPSNFSAKLCLLPAEMDLTPLSPWGTVAGLHSSPAR